MCEHFDSESRPSHVQWQLECLPQADSESGSEWQSPSQLEAASDLGSVGVAEHCSATGSRSAWVWASVTWAATAVARGIRDGAMWVWQHTAVPLARAVRWVWAGVTLAAAAVARVIRDGAVWVWQHTAVPLARAVRWVWAGVTWAAAAVASGIRDGEARPVSPVSSDGSPPGSDSEP